MDYSQTTASQLSGSQEPPVLPMTQEINALQEIVSEVCNIAESLSERLAGPIAYPPSSGGLNPADGPSGVVPPSFALILRLRCAVMRNRLAEARHALEVANGQIGEL